MSDDSGLPGQKFCLCMNNIVRLPNLACLCVMLNKDRIAQHLSVISWYVYYTTTRFGHIVRPSPGSPQIRIIKVSPKRDLSFDKQWITLYWYGFAD